MRFTVILRRNGWFPVSSITAICCCSADGVVLLLGLSLLVYILLRVRAFAWCQFGEGIYIYMYRIRYSSCIGIPNCAAVDWLKNWRSLVRPSSIYRFSFSQHIDHAKCCNSVLRDQNKLKVCDKSTTTTIRIRGSHNDTESKTCVKSAIGVSRYFAATWRNFAEQF